MIQAPIYFTIDSICWEMDGAMWEKRSFSLAIPSTFELHSIEMTSIDPMAPGVREPVLMSDYWFGETRPAGENKNIINFALISFMEKFVFEQRLSKGQTRANFIVHKSFHAANRIISGALYSRASVQDKLESIAVTLDEVMKNVG